ncbi:MAG TPA: SDR family NAD(P)-dependent oxidoreductase [Candidatus Paceibacterota bacterium]|nr:SDR family NAD(P)-dependent oxidoreductase [Verrucomicrobiota bacterium]HRY50382.1 SDR family NAD(P)-dependent oxidoreductase [Candidatus Paceibacterota bacterium]HSA03006.1 SDR family NAD(P)-dependent oxidoreductase [Candidatus Paceibacterota bacterium]
MESRLKDQWVLITGASSGFGAAAARAFGAEGSRLLLGARRVERLEEVAAEARQAGAADAQFHSLDVSSTDSAEEFVAWAKERIYAHSPGLGRLHVLVNNAGGALGLDPIAQGKDADWETMLQTNVLGILRMTRAALPLMLGQPGGAIINIGSIAGREVYEGGTVYCAAKAGELQITRGLRLELLGTGLRVCTIDPGMAETEFSIVRFKGDSARARKVYEGVHPLTAEDVAETIVWVANRPPHVCIDELIIKCAAQAAVQKVHRQGAQR